MRNLYIVLSILCFTLSGIVTFKALNLPEKNPLNPAALSQVKAHKSSHVVKEILAEPAIEQASLNLPVETLQNTNSQLEQKLTIKDNASQTVIQPAKSTTTQPEQKLTDKITDSQKNIQTLENTVKKLEQKLPDKIARAQKDTQSTKNTTAQQEYTPAPLKNVSQSKLNTNEPEKTKKISTVLLGDIAFKFGQFALDENMEKFIEQFAQQILAFSPNCRVIVEGHADNAGAKENNMDISYFRAKSVALEFEKQGISFKRISVTGYGDTRPFASNDKAEGRAKNRRVVVRLIPEEKEI
jgi:outer membrane protein OmpA-like peptidoglycan-associated protein